MEQKNPENTVDDYSVVRFHTLKNGYWKGLVIAIVWTIFFECVTKWCNLDPNHPINLVIILAAVFAVWIPLLRIADFIDRKHRICRALAGLELHVVECADDLVILLHIDRLTAIRIIDGDYDYLLSDPMYCKLLG